MFIADTFMLDAIAFLIVSGLIVLAVWIIRILAGWLRKDVIDRHRYHLTNPDAAGGVFRLDRKTGAVDYIPERSFCVSVEEQKLFEKEREKEIPEL
ncbi:MAG: hypothetical protein WCR44_04745 [Verrucomicrobiota bacterium]